MLHARDAELELVLVRFVSEALNQMLGSRDYNRIHMMDCDAAEFDLERRLTEVIIPMPRLSRVSARITPNSFVKDGLLQRRFGRHLFGIASLAGGTRGVPSRLVDRRRSGFAAAERCGHTDAPVRA